MTTRTQKPAIVLAGDYNFIRQIETTLKSICYHNSRIKFYIFNQDIPKEWFNYTRENLRKIGSELIDVKLLDGRLNQNWTVKNFDHINYMGYARYFVSEFVDEDIVLYLDCDLVVTGDILDLYSMELGENYVAAVYDLHGIQPYFNSGVLLINNEQWRQDDILEKLLRVTNEEYQNVPEGDQTILNNILGDRWIKLDGNYNFPIGYDYGAYTLGKSDIFEIPIKPLPTIIHYITPDKPWKTYSSSRLRNLWWYYNGLEWSEIQEKWSTLHLELPAKPIKLTFVTLTNSHLIEQLDYLVENLPDYEFKVAAFTDMAPSLLQLASYPNVTLYPNIIGPNLDTLLTNCDAYLDINHGDKFIEYLMRIEEERKPIITFDTTSSPAVKEMIFPNDKPELMVKYLKKFTK